MRKILVAAVTLTFVAANAGAQVVYNTGFCCSHTDGVFGLGQAAVNFKLTGPNVVTQANLYVYDFNHTIPSQSLGTVQWYVLANNGATPGSVLTSGSSEMTYTQGGFASFNLNSGLLSANTQYWLYMSSPNDDHANLFWLSAFIPPGGAPTMYGTPGGPWTPMPVIEPGEFNNQIQSLSLELVSTPEPTSLAFLATGIVGMVPFLRRRRSKTPCN